MSDAPAQAEALRAQTEAARAQREAEAEVKRAERQAAEALERAQREAKYEADRLESQNNDGAWYSRRYAPSTPSNRYPEGFLLKVISARPMRDPKNHKKSIGLYEVCTFSKDASTFDSYHANNKRWKRFSEFEQLNKLIDPHLDKGVSTPSLPSKHSIRGPRSKVLLEERRKGLEEYLKKLVSIFINAKNFKLKLVVVRWLNLHMGQTYVQHINQNSGLDINTAEYIDPSDAENDKNDSLFSGFKAPKMPKMGMPSMPKLGMPSMSMPKMSMPDMPSMPSMPGLPGLPSLGDDPEAIKKRDAAELAEREENQLAWIDALTDHKLREHQITARAIVYNLHSNNGWVYYDEATKFGDHWTFDRTMGRAVRTTKTDALIGSNDNTHKFFFDEPEYVSGEVAKLKLKKEASKPGVLNYGQEVEDDCFVIQVQVGRYSLRTLDIEYMGEKGPANRAAKSSNPDVKDGEKAITKTHFAEGPAHA